MIGLYLQMGAALIGVIGLIYLVGLFLKKRQDKDSLMKIVGWQSLGPKKGLAIVRVADETLLMAVTPTDVKLLKELDGEAVEAAAETAPGRPVPPVIAGISDKLKRLKTLKDTLYAVK